MTWHECDDVACVLTWQVSDRNKRSERTLAIGEHRLLVLKVSIHQNPRHHSCHVITHATSLHFASPYRVQTDTRSDPGVAVRLHIS